MHHMFTLDIILEINPIFKYSDVLLKTLTYSSSMVATHREQTEEKAVTKNIFAIDGR